MSDLAAFQTRLGYRFREESLLRLALTHPSVANDQQHPLPHNQRLEFLGDAVLGVMLSRQLYEAFPDADEGTLSKSRARLVNAESLALRARALKAVTITSRAFCAKGYHGPLCAVCANGYYLRYSTPTTQHNT